MPLDEQKLHSWISDRIEQHQKDGRLLQMIELKRVNAKVYEIIAESTQTNLRGDIEQACSDASDQITNAREKSLSVPFDPTDRIRSLGECIRALTEAMDVANGGEACHEGVKACLCFNITMISGMIMKLAGRGCGDSERLEKLLDEFILQMKSNSEFAAKCSIYPNGEAPVSQVTQQRPDVEADPDPLGEYPTI